MQKLPNFIKTNAWSVKVSVFTLITVFLSVFTSSLYGQCPVEVTGLPADFTIDAGDECSAIVTWTPPSYSLTCDDFTGNFDATDPTIWSVNINEGDGTDGIVNTTNAPADISITGSTDGTNNINTNTDFCVTIPFDGNLSFDWLASVTPPPPGAQLNNDEPAYSLDGAEVILNAMGSSVSENGSVTDLAVTEGQVFCFRVRSNNRGAETTMVISNFSFENIEINQTSGVALDSEQPIGDYDIEYSVVDCDGDVSTCEFTILVRELIVPTIVCPDDITMDTDQGFCTADVTVAGPITDDNCSVASVINDFNDTSDASGIYPLGTTIVTWTVTDGSGNTAECSFNVIVEDNQFPVFDCPEDLEFDLEPKECNIAVDFDVPEATDNCPGILIVQTEGLASGAEFPIGINVVTFEATDGSGNVTECTFNVIVNDYEPEGLACLGSMNFSIDPETCGGELTAEMLLLTQLVGCLDSCTVSIIEDDGTKSSAIIDASDIGKTLQYEVCCGDYCCWGDVFVEDKLAPEITCTDVTISCNGVGNIPYPVVGDDCQNTEFVLINEVKENIDCDDDYIGMIQRTYIGVDSGGNESEPCTQTIMLERITVGIINPPAAFLFPNNNLTCGSGFATDENGNPALSVTGAPTTGSENYGVTTADFNYVDITATGIKVVTGDDQAMPVLLGNEFPVYGMTFTSLAVSENGYITTDLADSGPDWTNDCPLPSDPSSPANTTGARIYPLHDDLDADIMEDMAAGVYYQYFAVSPVVSPKGASTGVSIFQWKVDHFNATGAADIDFQALLFDNGEIMYQYNEIASEMGSGATVGIQSNAMENNMAPINATTVSCDTPGSVIAGTSVGLTPPLGIVSLYPFDNSIFCSGYSLYQDQVLSDNGCVKKIMRKFTIGEWHCNSTNERFIFQMIDVVDDQAPTVSAPNDMTISTATFSCSASVPLPGAIVSDQCNDVEVDVAYPYGFLDNQNGGLVVLPVGEHIVTYTAYDACLNSASSTMTVTVVDQADPIAICDGFDIVSIGTGNSASLTAIALDDGSFDECGDVTLSVARMDDPGFDDGSAFAPAAEFDCSDIGEEIMVALLVTDMGGNTNMCMVQVEVQDKIDAFISCPADITVDCTTAYDLNNLDSFGVPTITDNCTETAYEEIVDTDFNQCGVGTILRTFTVVDNGARTCSQLITFENQNAPFGEANIEWPDDYIAPNGCTEADLSPAALDAIDTDFGFPVIEDMSTCILTGANSTDEEFIGGGGACRTIYRTWKVIDWCSPELDGSFPIFEHIQTIEVNNVTAPTFVSSTETITVESYAADCIAPVPVDGLVAVAEDDCTPDANLNYTYIIDLDDDGTNDETGVGPDASGTYQLGTHSVRFTVADGCGNVAFQERLFTIVNLKTATAYCLDNIAVSLVQMDPDGDGIFEPMAMVTPDIIDGGSFHSCGYSIQISFSEDVNDQLRTYNCSSIGDQDIEIWVTDENGNADYCTTTIEIQDNNQFCINPGKVEVAGMIYTEDVEEVDGVQVGLMGADVIYDMTEETGEYAFPDMPVGDDYMVLPYKNDNHSNGVSTLDLVLVQRHILGLGDLDSPYKMIAADVNYNQGISAADIVILRKMILGVYSEFPGNNSWRFVDAEYNFPDATNPWLGNIPEDYSITALNSDMNIDYIGVKTGDVNGSVTANAQSISTETRSDNTWTLAIDDKQVGVGEIVTVNVKSADISKVYGWQYTLETNDLNLVNIASAKANVSTQNINDDKGSIHMSYGEANGLDVLAEDVLYTITLQANRAGKLSEMLSISDRGIRSESYHTNMEINKIEIRWDETTAEPVIVEEFSVTQNEPNPWYDRTTVGYYIPEAGDVRFVVKDVAGRTLYSTSAYREKGKHTQAIEARFIESNGVLLYELHYDDQVISNRMIHIK